jgi:uncharacterized protein involved in exopolysaccharide biosynthesis
MRLIRGIERGGGSRPSVTSVHSAASFVVVAVSVVAVTAVAVAASLVQTPMYSATSKLVLLPRPADVLQTAAAPEDEERILQTEMQVITSQRVRNIVEQRLGDAPAVSVAPAGPGDVINVTVRSEGRRHAAEAANAYAAGYIDFRRQQMLTRLGDASRELTARLSALQRAIQRAPAGAASRDALVAQYSALAQKLDDVQLQATLADGGAQLLSQATPPRRADTPGPGESALVGMVAGLLLGVALVALIGRIRRASHPPEHRRHEASSSRSALDREA